MKNSQKKKKGNDNSLAITLGIIFALIILPITVVVLQHQQQTTQLAASTQPQPSGPTGSWNLVWDDEFNDAPGMSGPTNGLEKSKWNSGWQSGPATPGNGDTTAITAPVQSQESEYYGPAGIIFPSDNSVHLRLQKGIDNGGSYGGKSIESGMISTAGLMALNPANVSVSSSLQPYTINGTSIVEIRARIPGPNADAGEYWPGWWMTNAGNYSNGSSWPGGTKYSEEIDLAEWYETGSLGSNGKFHYHANSEYGGMSSLPGSMQNTDVSLAYHTYTYEFNPTQTLLWVDGMPVTGVSPTTAQTQAQWKYPQYLMLTFQAYANPKYPSSATGQPSDMMIDYVRVFQQCSSSCSPTVSVPSGTVPNPTFGTIGDCNSNNTCPTNTPTNAQTTQTPTISITTSPAVSTIPSLEPSATLSTFPTLAPINNPGKGNGNFLNLFLQFLIQLLQLLSQLFGTPKK